MAPPTPRSCVTCARRKVKCDRESPCGHCRHANIPCIISRPEPRPRWARKIHHDTTHTVSRNKSCDGGETPDILQVLRSVQNELRHLHEQVIDMKLQLNTDDVALNPHGKRQRMSHHIDLGMAPQTNENWIFGSYGSHGTSSSPGLSERSCSTTAAEDDSLYAVQQQELEMPSNPPSQHFNSLQMQDYGLSTSPDARDEMDHLGSEWIFESRSTFANINQQSPGTHISTAEVTGGIGAQHVNTAPPYSEMMWSMP